MARLRLLSLILVAALTTPAAAENVNIELTDLLLTVPSSSYGAASGQVGVWNDGNPQLATLQPLVDTGGNLIVGAGLTVSAGEGRTNLGNNGLTTGDDDNLLDDGLFVVGPDATLTISGLAAGVYSVYTYAYDADVANLSTSISVNGGLGQTVSGTRPFVDYTTNGLGKAYALHVVSISSSQDIVVTATKLGTLAFVSGIQIVPGGQVGVEGQTWGATKALFR